MHTQTRRNLPDVCIASYGGSCAQRHRDTCRTSASLVQVDHDHPQSQRHLPDVCITSSALSCTHNHRHTCRTSASLALLYHTHTITETPARRLHR
ncbi:hypothetical protein PoB_003177000 [Plakobranchus ocellatus]|uniref:Uncharacterized protein n=1 Tax=Plakobranchus ocellatus TaxID=259542 RepID=A0AAV4AES7_9GAST|nr:hypothetical protein PoB_003177000 [Plakobranchus ocellatus]